MKVQLNEYFFAEQTLATIVETILERLYYKVILEGSLDIHCLLEKLFFRQSVKYLQEKQFWLGEVHGETEEKKKFCCYLKKNFFLFLSQSFANWKKRWLKSLIREQ